MNPAILKKEVQEFLRENIHTNVRDMALKKSPFSEVSSAELAQQLKGLIVAAHKFPLFYETPGFYYPPSINLEQSSSQKTAEYKSNLISGKTLIDLTAGMGVDAFFFSKNFESVTALERNRDLAEICNYNYKLLNNNLRLSNNNQKLSSLHNFEYINTEFEDYFESHPQKKWDVIYLDPARRKGSKKKFLLEDLEPNILDWMPEFFKRAEKVMIKLSPLLDLKLLIKQIPSVGEIHLVAVKNEMKELLVICEDKTFKEVKIRCVNLDSDQQDFEFNLSKEENAEEALSKPLNYIYEPNAAVMKSGAFKLIGERFGLKKLHPNTHLYTSLALNEDFPGRVFQMMSEVKSSKDIEKGSRWHVISRNYPLSAEAVKKKYKLKEGEEETLIFTQSIEGKHILKCVKVGG